MDSSATPDVSAGLRRAGARLDALSAEITQQPTPSSVSEWLEVRAHIGRSLRALDDSLGELDEAFGVTSGRARLLEYLRTNEGSAVTMDDLAGVAGISEWARRIRELRENEGWVIHTHTTDPSLHPGTYRLTASRPHRDVVEVWAAAKSSAKLTTRGGAMDPAARLAHFLDVIAPRPAALDQLNHVVGDASELDAILRELKRRGIRVERVSPTDPICPGGARLSEC